MRNGGRRDLGLLLRLAEQARPCWPHVGALLVVSLVAIPLALLMPLPVKIAVDTVLGAQPLPPSLAALLPAAATSSPTATLWLAAGMVVAIALLVHVQGLAAWLLQTYTGERLVLGLRARMFQHAQRLSLSYHDRRGVAEAIYRVQSDAHGIQHVMIGIIPFITSTVTLVAMIGIVARIDWPLAVVALAISPALFVLTGASRNRLRDRWLVVKEFESRALGVAHEVLAALRVVKAFGREDHEHDRFVRHASRTVRGQTELAAIEGSFDLLVGVTLAVGTAAVLFIGVGHVIAGTLSLGALLVVLAYLTQLYGPLETISKKVADLQSALASAERAFALLDEAPDVAERPNARPLPRARGAVEFQDVTFAYGDGPTVLESISFAVEPGARVGIVGTSGAGKTTLVNLFSRFYDPTGGVVLLDGVDVRDWRVRDLRQQFAIVLQDPVLFSTTIGENIAYARPDASVDEIVAAARAANADDFIERLPDGYATQVGERGMRLSGGERQRIALARAFLKDAPILVLDEPTSSIDGDTEALVVDAMERLMQERTAFIIAHRPTTLRGCDVLLRIEGGRLVSPRGVAAVTPAAVGAGQLLP